MNQRYMSLFCLLTLHIFGQETYVLGSHIRNPGFFSCFMGVLNRLPWVVAQHKKPVVYWDEVFVFYDPQGYNGSTENGWEYYFEPISDGSYKKGDFIDREFSAPDGWFIFSWNTIHNVTKFQRHWVKETIIDPFIKINKHVRSKIDAFYNQFMQGKKTVGIHLRGTDKCAEVAQVDPEIILAEANKHTGCQFLVATDEQELLDLAKIRLNGPVIYYDCYRSENKLSIHAIETAPYSRAKLGEDVLIECLLLSKCDTFIHTNSNVSVAALYFNPELDNILLEA